MICMHSTTIEAGAGYLTRLCVSSIMNASFADSTADTAEPRLYTMYATPDLAYSRTYTDSEGREHKQLIALCQNCHEQIHNRTLNLSAKKKFTNEEKW